MEMRHEGEDEGILVDVSVLERALENLVHHAIKHAPSRSTIAVSVRNADAAVQFLVEDEGEGIPDADRKRLFDPFQRGDLPEHGSLGLGLAFCKAAAERHGGHIWIEDGAQGRGTRIVLQIPDAPTD